MNIEKFFAKANEIDNGYIVAALTDQYIVDTWPMTEFSLDGKESRVLELRVFNSSVEYKLIRPDIASEFIFRDSNSIEYDYSYTENQFLDIDTDKSAEMPNGWVMATGGGKYKLPVSRIEDAYIVIEYYVSKYPDSGQARICDWRMVGIKEGR